MSGRKPITEESLGNEIARVRHGQDVTASDLANRLMPWLTAHDAEVRAGVVTEEPEWEYGTRCPMRECTEPHLIERGDCPPQPEESVWRRTKERPAGPWVPVEQEGSSDD